MKLLAKTTTPTTLMRWGGATYIYEAETPEEAALCGLLHNVTRGVQSDRDGDKVRLVIRLGSH